MKQLNFLPASIRQRQERQREGVSYVVAVVAGIAISGSLWLFWHGQQAIVADQVARAQSQAAAEQAQLAKQQKSDAIDPDTLQRVTLLNSLSKTEIDWPTVFAKIGLLVDKNVYLNNATLATSDTAVTVKVSGLAPSNVVFASFVEGLQANTSISGLTVDTYAFNPTTSDVNFGLTYSLPISLISYQSSK